MNVPGSNLLAYALTVICPDSFVLHRFTGKTTNTIGLDVSAYAAPETFQGSIQAVGRRLYADMGLDFTRRYISIWVSTNIDDLYRGRAGDQVTWNGTRWQVIDENDWHPIDGWDSIIAVQVPES